MRFFLCCLLAVICLPLEVAVAESTTVHEHRLENGLKVLVKEDHRAPVVVSQVWYKVGSSYEYGGITGVSHILEHMMFKGTSNHAPGDFSRIIAENGGQENAFTGRDYTAYFQRLEKSRLEISFELEADRMRNLKLNAEEFGKERQVVLEERRMRTDDRPRSKTSEYFSAAAHTNGGYKNPVIGWPDDIRQLTVEDLQRWYQLWYAPGNATLVVVGDVDPQEVFELAERYFGPLEAGPPAEMKSRLEVEQIGERRVTIRLPAELPYLLMGYKVPVLKTVENPDDAYALEVLAGILDGGSSARLSSRLVRGKQIALSAGAGYDLYARLRSLFTVSALPAGKQSLAEVEKALREEIGLLQKELVTERELNRVKAQVLANEIYELDSIFYQAMQIGTLETVGLGWKTIYEYVDRIKLVTPEQVRDVARRYLVDEKLTVAYLDPLPMNANNAKAPARGERHAH